MWIELAVYELVTGILPFAGLKVIADKSHLKGINQPRRTPFDGYLKRRTGCMSKSEKFISSRVVKLIHTVSEFSALNYLLVLGARHVRTKAKRGVKWSTGKELG